MGINADGVGILLRDGKFTPSKRTVVLLLVRSRLRGFFAGNPPDGSGEREPAGNSIGLLELVVIRSAQD